KGGWWVLSHLGLILQARKKTQALRVMGDAELLSAGNLSFVPDVVKAGFATRVKAGLDGFFNGYWNAVKGLLS
ncbi:MAG: hypothetical protein OET90_05345, partial [Desulfuromonadales bacterium]|nr:hypothetical protein [Desulfuromonadales bacterium]